MSEPTKHTPGPWSIRWSYCTAGVNDGSHANWTPPRYIAPGQCGYCGNTAGELVRAFSDKGESFHTHRFQTDDWHRVTAADGTEITGNYDYDSGGVCSSEADARLIAAAPDLLEELKNIANANTRDWDDPGDFKAWAQNRARHAIAKAEGRDDA